MKVSEEKIGRTFTAKLDDGDDLYVSLQAIADTNGIGSGFFFAIGAMNGAHFQNRVGKEPRFIQLDDQGLQLTSCMGTFSTIEGSIKVHVHANVAQGDGQTRGGHVVEKNIISNRCEILVFELLG